MKILLLYIVMDAIHLGSIINRVYIQPKDWMLLNEKKAGNSAIATVANYSLFPRCLCMGPGNEAIL